VIGVNVSASPDGFPGGQLYVGRTHIADYDRYSCAELVHANGDVAGWIFNFSDQVAHEEFDQIAAAFGCPADRFRGAMSNWITVP
jgi:hypothetical protein